jgi:formate hydrogenlyase subunit 3/multisubunit Na+/H+ antiporter MnhD subunit
MHPHRFEPASLIFGLLFAAGGMLVLTSSIDLWRVNWSWFWPLALTISGVMVLVSLRSDSPPNPDATPSDDPADY